PKAKLDDTFNTQPALFAMSAALLALLPERTPDFVAGHSLGEYAALYAAGVFSFADGLRLVRERGRLMKAAGDASPGGMAAIIGLDDATVTELCRKVGGLQVANYNSPGQVVVSGRNDAVSAVMQAAKERKAKLVSALDVSIAAHSELMQPAVDEFTRAVHNTPMREPRTAVIANITARPLASVDAIRDELAQQLTSSVQWTASVEYMTAQGVSTFVEIGPGKVLTGLIKRIAKGAQLVNVGDAASLRQFSSEETA
ncbi:MAG: ACP S-malonyltransferase, partial [Chloroflexi bacterium]|nr:ACP S-malonyltransferase [Chloroflexota bacterium]